VTEAVLTASRFEASRAGRRKAWAALVLLAMAVAVTASLGRWQLNRAEEKQALLEQEEAGRQMPPLRLSSASSPADLKPWRQAEASGHWLADRTVLLENRMSGSRPGFWVVTPLVLDSGAAVAVLRGWLPRPMPDGPVAVETPAGEVTVRGVLLSQIPRLLDLARFGGRAQDLPSEWPGSKGEPPRLQNLDLAAYGHAAGLALLPVVLEQTDAAPDGLGRDWAGPPANVDTHRGYALQWFSFAAIAAIAFGVVLVRTFRSTH